MYDKLVDAIANMWATHPDAATPSLHWATIDQQLDADGDRETLEFARTVGDRAADAMKAKLS